MGSISWTMSQSMYNGAIHQARGALIRWSSNKVDIRPPAAFRQMHLAFPISWSKYWCPPYTHGASDQSAFKQCGDWICAMIHCPYTDQDIPEERANIEHVIPLSLGGVDDLIIRVDATFNSQAGSKLDGALANEFLFSLLRTGFDARGHSGKKPNAVIKKAHYRSDKRPAQVYFYKKDGLNVWDARDREIKEGVSSFHISTQLSIDLPVRLTAKVALGAGYFTYGKIFRHNVDHRQLRDAMNIDPINLDPDKSLDEQGLGYLTYQAESYLDEVSEESNPLHFYVRSFCSQANGSVVVFMPGRDILWVAVGILGFFLGMIKVPANTAAFPHQDEHLLGHVLDISGKTLHRYSWADGLAQGVEG